MPKNAKNRQPLYLRMRFLEIVSHTCASFLRDNGSGFLILPPKKCGQTWASILGAWTKIPLPLSAKLTLLIDCCLSYKIKCEV